MNVSDTIYIIQMKSTWLFASTDQKTIKIQNINIFFVDELIYTEYETHARTHSTVQTMEKEMRLCVDQQ